MTTTSNIHGHEILHLIQEATPPLSRQALRAQVEQRWGAAARFCTCSAFDMSLDELLGFLASRGKIVERGGELLVDVSQICGHGGEHHH